MIVLIVCPNDLGIIQTNIRAFSVSIVGETDAFDVILEVCQITFLAIREGSVAPRIVVQHEKAPGGIIGKRGLIAQRIGHRGLFSPRVVSKRGYAHGSCVTRLCNRAHTILTVHQQISERELGPVGLRNGRNTTAAAIVGIGRGESLTVGDAIVVRTQVHDDLRQTPLRVVGVAHSGRRDQLTTRITTDGAQCGQLPGRVVIEIGDVAAVGRDLRQQARSAVGVGHRVAVDIARGDQAPGFSRVIGLRERALSIVPFPCIRCRVERQRAACRD
ncbi:hypothetical protein AWB80_04370 [Caballeronia pedi]|uniref:Uncharacterized protein n=1 Tax=Caballeronia pedi TaxID=1777141 RepID=A0A158C088_9BURK|nr:hypothetical protein AWB80_04370 [Caballeronia pedi]